MKNKRTQDVKKRRLFGLVVLVTSLVIGGIALFCYFCFNSFRHKDNTSSNLIVPPSDNSTANDQFSVGESPDSVKPIQEIYSNTPSSTSSKYDHQTPKPDKDRIYHEYYIDGKRFEVTYKEGEDPESGEGTTDIIYNAPGGVYTDYYQFKFDNSLLKVRKTQRYDEVVTANQNYEHMRLTLMWINTDVEPWELKLLNHDESLEYAPVESFPGSRVYVIDDVKAGDSFIFKYYWENPGGIDIQQEEELDYEDYYLNRG